MNTHSLDTSVPEAKKEDIITRETMALEYLTSEIWSSRVDPETQRVEEVIFFVGANEDGKPVEFALEAVTENAYDAWMTEREVEGHLGEEAFPLVIPDTLAPHGIVKFIQGRYLNTETPGSIEAIRQFMFPLDGSNGEAA